MDIKGFKNQLEEYTGILLRRKWSFIIPFVLVVIGTGIYLMITPKKYMASSTILVTPQKVPVDYIRPTVTLGVEARIQSMSQEIMSRTRLEPLINEFNLYPEERKKLTKEEIIEMMRKEITIKIGGREGYFNISYIGEDPITVARVINKMASLYIEENLRMREQQAVGTTEFLEQELKLSKERLEKQEMEVMEYKKKYMNELPEQRDANLNILQQLQRDHQRISDTLRSAQDRKVVVQKQLAEMKKMAAQLMTVTEEEEETAPEKEIFTKKEVGVKKEPKVRNKTTEEIQLESMRNQLLELQSKYTKRHPDVISAQKKVVELELKVRDLIQKENQDSRQIPEIEKQTEIKEIPARSNEKKEKSKRVSNVDNSFYQEMEDQLGAIDEEIRRINDEDLKIRKKIKEYQERVENSPTRELQIVGLMRDYTRTKEQYENLLRKILDSQQAENLERRQKGEQFRVIDPARIPEKPFKPNIPRTIAMGVGLGFFLGLGFAWFREMMDQTFHSESEIEHVLKLPVIAVIPNLKEKMTRRRKAA